MLLGRMFLYFKGPGETSPTGEINMRDAKVEEVEHISDDSDEEARDDAQDQAKLTIAIFPQHQVRICGGYSSSIILIFFCLYRDRLIYFWRQNKNGITGSTISLLYQVALEMLEHSMSN